MKAEGRELSGPHRLSIGIYTKRLAPLRFKSEPATRKLNLDDALVFTNKGKGQAISRLFQF